ncbi:MAG: hypothetical protein K2N01_12035 [Lachnospiraceae bacterium]|nr:hypothetical protein [Lachnospiraceae bacterium]
MYRIRQAWLVTMTNFRRWRRDPKIILVFGLAFVVCFLLSDKVIRFAEAHDTLLQLGEPFIWTFGDANSVLVVSLLLLLLFADMPNLGNEVPLFLIRIDRKIWMLGQIFYLILATIALMCFILLSTCLLAGARAYPANLWSDTAAILGYSSIGEQIAIPAFVKVLELSFPYECMLHIFGLMLGYSVLMAGLILYLNLWRGNGGMIGGIVFSGFGFLLNPEVIAQWFDISRQRMKLANIAFGWMSPLNHATYYMHNFGYDNLPKLWVSYVFFGAGCLLLFGLSMLRIRNYNFNFTGTEK